MFFFMWNFDAQRGTKHTINQTVKGWGCERILIRDHAPPKERTQEANEYFYSLFTNVHSNI